MIPIACKITDFSLYLFVYFFENIIIFSLHIAIVLGEYSREMCTPIIIEEPISQYASCSAMFCPLHSNIGKEQHEKHLCNPSSHYREYGEYTRETRAPYLDT